MGFFADEREAFELSRAGWRAPQIGALGSLIAHWSLTPDEPALVSLPTGAGKTGVALAAPFVVPVAPTRVLVLVPSAAVRDQMVRAFSTMRLLREIRALSRWHEPTRIRAVAVEGHSTDWGVLQTADVVVAIPQSISPGSESAVSVPPSDMFDMIIVDEAHHLPSKTWHSVLDHSEAQFRLLLTATPFRLDRKPVPGTRAYYFPLRQAISEGFYKPIRPLVLPRPVPYDMDARDGEIATEVMRLLQSPEHSTSTLLVRAHSRARAVALTTRYRQLGLEIDVLTSQLNDVAQTLLIRRLQRGELRAVAVVGMLGEGFDLPRLRLVAYHDKHKSMPATVQLIGRLARVSDEFPQESVLVTVDDSDVHPELLGVVRALYKEDADWATILPGLVDAEIAAEAAVRAFVDSFDEREGEIDPAALRPMPRPTVYEIDNSSWRPLSEDGELPESVHIGSELAGARVLMAVAASDSSFTALVTRRRGVPAWSGDLSLESIEYGLSVVSFRQAPRTDLPCLLFVDAADNRIHQALLEAFGVPDSRRPVASARLDGYMQSLPRTSVSSIGMRNILAGTRGTTYKTRAGSNTDSDLLSTETTQTALGHVMLQIKTSEGSTTVGAAFEKGKLWQRRYKPLVDYAAWITEAAELLWFPRAGVSSALLPQISRGRPLLGWPDVAPIAIEPNPAVAVGGYQLFDGDEFVASMEDFELFAGIDPTGAHSLPPHTAVELPVVGVAHDRARQQSEVRWTGVLRLNGMVQTTGRELVVRRGYGEVGAFAEFLEHYPPLVYFLNGQAVQGHELFDVSAGAAAQYDPRNVLTHDWMDAGVDIFAETRATAIRRAQGISIHEGLERYLAAQPQTERWRWIICNDGSGEIADYLVIEYTPQRPIRLSLWHAKGAGGNPGLRIDDFQVVVSQALRSRSRYNDPALWDDLRERVMGRQAPAATIVAGSASRLRLLLHLGERSQAGRVSSRSWTRTRPLIHGEICIVQPGLSRAELLASPSGGSGTTAQSLYQLFGVVNDTVAATGKRALILGSP